MINVASTTRSDGVNDASNEAGSGYGSPLIGEHPSAPQKGSINQAEMLSSSKRAHSEVKRRQSSGSGSPTLARRARVGVEEGSSSTSRAPSSGREAICSA